MSKLRPSGMQRRAINSLLTGETKNPRQAMLKAGYSEGSAGEPGRVLIKTPGVHAYLKELDQKSIKKYGMSIREKTLDVFADALEATKVVGKRQDKERPDHQIRVATAERLAKYFGWDQVPIEKGSGEYNQFNFFNVDSNKQKQFHENLKSIIQKSYD